jgi:oligogalacturonide lyase
MHYSHPIFRRGFSPGVGLAAAFLLLAGTSARAQNAANTTTPAGANTTTAPAGDDLPREWIDPDTGHRVIRISDVPGSESLYFHYNSYTPQGDKMVFSVPNGIAAVDLTTLGQGQPKLDLIVSGPSRVLAAAWQTRDVYFAVGGGANTQLWAANIDTHALRKVTDDRVLGVNSDETYTVSTLFATDPTGATPVPVPRTPVDQRVRMFGDLIKAGIPLTPEQEEAADKENGLSRNVFNPRSMAFAFKNLQTNQTLVTGSQYAQLNHLQFSPTDPNLLLYCHEGTWHEVDRIWTIRTDGSAQKLRHARTMDMEIAGHEFWSHDGQTIWFDLQTPRSQDFWLAGVNIATGRETRYHLQRDWWGIHFNANRDNTLFATDGGDPTQVAFAKDGEWINLLRVQPDGTVTREKLVNLSRNNYVTGDGGIEPNVSITPDNKWVVFRANILGPVEVFAVEIAKASPAAAAK